MVTVDAKSSAGPSNPLSDTSSEHDILPPSYDLATSHLTYGASSSSHSPTQGATPASSVAQSNPAQPHLAHLFAGPPNVEPLLPRDGAQLIRVNDIVTEKRGGNIMTTDPRLKDPSVLCDFLRKEALSPPSFKVHIVGAHTETRTTTETVYENRVARPQSNANPERIVDFDFTIDLTPIVTHEDTLNHINLHTTLPETAAHRGTHNLTFSPFYAPPSAPSLFQNLPIQQCLPISSAHHTMYDLEELKLTDPGRVATWRETRLHDSYTKWRTSKGIPEWINPRSDLVKDFWESRSDRLPASEGAGSLRLSESEEEEERGLLDVEQTGEGLRERLDDARTKICLREWCESYCSSPGLLKEFHLTKGVWGWDLAGLQAAVRGAVLSTGYQSNECSVEFETSEDRIIVKSDNWFSKALNRPLVVLILWITLLYPIIWLWQRLHPLGGARWDIARASYSTKFYPPLPETYPSETIQTATTRLPTLYKLHPQLPPTPTLQRGPKGVHYLVGKKEGEWFREWEDRIRMAVRLRYKGELEGGFERGEVPDLDGY